MRILFVTHSAFLPEVKRGQERNTDQLCRALRARGHETAVLAGLISAGFVGKCASVKSRFGDRRRPVRDPFAGYPIYRSWDVDHAFDAAVADFAPDIVVVQSWMRTVQRCIERHLPVAYYVHAANEPPDPGSDRVRRETLWLTVSEFAAQHNAAHGVSFHVVPPLVDPALYRIAEREPWHATVVGLQSFKGGERVLELARACPEIPFLIFDNIDHGMPQWPGMSGAELRAAAAALPNVKIRAAVSSAAALYGSTKLLLAPSRCPEAWGRVVSEAQVNGIPVLASDRGGLPEAVGPGGICLDYDASIGLWTAHLKAMWHNPAYYAALSHRALTHAARVEFQSETIVSRLVELLEAHTAGMAVPAPCVIRDRAAAEAAESTLG